jgi:succinate dehydrogenase / fumarate reductase cytochrome b subunit
MAKSALLKSSLAKKYWMALTGLFLCLFLVGHLIGNLQLIFGDALQFNQYALFMTSNPAVKALSYVTYISIIFHAVDGIILTIQNQKARPVGYAYERPQANSTWQSRNMAVLGTVILVFIVTHMVNFWAKMHFDKNMPLQTMSVQANPVLPPQNYYLTTNGNYLPVDGVAIKNRTEFYSKEVDVKIGEGYKDLHKITVAFFKDKQYGLIATLLYVVAMAVLAFHLNHGFASAFQSLGANHQKYNGLIRGFGFWFSVIVPLLFAIIPLYIHFVLKA